jgi:hypothetical protein
MNSSWFIIITEIWKEIAQKRRKSAEKRMKEGIIQIKSVNLQHEKIT